MASTQNALKKEIIRLAHLKDITFRPDGLSALLDFLKKNGSSMSDLGDIIDRLAEKCIDIDSAIDAAIFSSCIDDIATGPAGLSNFEVIQHIDAFDMPHFKWSSAHRSFVRVPPASILPSSASASSSSAAAESSSKPARVLFGSAEDKASMFTERVDLLFQRTLRHSMFTSATSQSSISKSKRQEQDQTALQLTTVNSLVGSSGTKYVLGLLSQMEDGRYYLEDSQARVRVDIATAKYTTGFFTEMDVVLAAGEFRDDIFHVDLLGMPPKEAIVDTKKFIGHYLAGEMFGAPLPQSDIPVIEQLEADDMNMELIVFADVFLDKPSTLARLNTQFASYNQRPVPPPLIILIGDFLSISFGSIPKHAQVYKQNFDNLADIILQYENLANKSTFIFIPGPNDPGIGPTLPRPRIPQYFVSNFQSRIPHCIFSSNPCRLRVYTQEIVIFRSSLLRRMRSHCIVPPLEEEENMAVHLVKTLLDQAHLSPLPLTVAPIYWTYDHALRLFPAPNVLILADDSDHTDCVFEETKFFMPGSFGNDAAFVSYKPANRRHEFQILR